VNTGADLFTQGTNPNTITDRQFRGFLSDVRILDVVRSPADIFANYRQRLVGNESGLMGYWKLDQYSGSGWSTYSVVLDSTANRTNGVLTLFATPSANWVIPTPLLPFSPRIANFVLGPKNGVYDMADASFSFVDPSSNSMGDFSYTVSSGNATVANSGVATTKIVYSTPNPPTPISVPALTTYEFPMLAELSDWRIDISFTATGGNGTARALVGDMYNEVDISNGWSVSLSPSNRIRWSWLNTALELNTIFVGLNTPYNLTVAQSSATSTLAVTLANVATTDFGDSATISNLVSWYKFDNNENDYSANGNNLGNVGAVAYSATDYKKGSASAVFNGSNYFEVSNDGRFSPDNFSVALWIKPVSGSGHQAIAACRDADNFTGWVIYISPNNSLEFWTGNGMDWVGGDVPLLAGFGNLTEWTHVAFTITKSTGAFATYINGNLVASATRSYANMTAYNMRIGAGTNEQSAGFHIGSGAKIDDFRFYNKVLTASEVDRKSVV
jgi:hypothetical protein